MERVRQAQFLFGDRDQYVSGNGAPNLRLERVLAGAEEALNVQVLLDPLEEQFDTPATLVQRTNRRCCKRHVVGQEHQLLARFEVCVTDPAHRYWVTLNGQEPRQLNPLVGADPGVGRERLALNDTTLHIAFGTGYEVGFGALEGIQAFEIDVGFVHYVERTGFDKSLIRKDIEHLYVVHLAVADVDKTGDGASQVQQGMQLDGRFGLAKRCPRKQRQAQIDGGGVERVNRCLEFAQQRTVEFVVRVKCGGGADQILSQLGKNLPRPRGVGVSQGVARDALAAQTHVIPLYTFHPQVELDTAQRIAPSELCVGHDVELIEAGKILDLVLSAMGCNHARESLDRKLVHELREDKLARKHDNPWLDKVSKHARLCKNHLYRGQTKLPISSNNSLTYQRSAQ